jgi:integration host factor subunit beta
MTRAELLQDLCKRHPQLPEEDVKFAFTIVLEAIGEAIAQHRRVEIRGFGSFRAQYRGERLSRNPRTGEPVRVPSKTVPHFKPGLDLRERVKRS